MCYQYIQIEKLLHISINYPSFIISEIMSSTKIIIATIIVMILVLSLISVVHKSSSSSSDDQSILNHLSTIKFLPTTGYEPQYTPWLWNDNDYTSKHNCYDYAFDNFDLSQPSKSHPGTVSNKYVKSNHKNSCDHVHKMLMSDHPDLMKVNSNELCPDGTYKIFLSIDPDDDYHFYRQDASGFWSHKPGKTNVINTDANGELIVDPSISDHNYTRHNYDSHCGFYCVNIKNKYSF